MHPLGLTVNHGRFAIKDGVNHATRQDAFAVRRIATAARKFIRSDCPRSVRVNERHVRRLAHFEAPALVPDPADGSWSNRHAVGHTGPIKQAGVHHRFHDD